MFRIWTLVGLILFLTASLAPAQGTNPISLSKTFSKIPGTPRLARNEAENSWLVVWRQGTPGKMLGRIVPADGSPGKQKTLVKGLNTAAYSFDVAYNSVTSRYLLAYESWQGLQVQLFDTKMSKQGSATLIENGLQGSLVRLAYDPDSNQFLIFWLASQDGLSGQLLNVLVLDSAGGPSGNPITLAKAGLSKMFESLSAVRNPKTRNFMIMMLERAPNTIGSIIGYTVKPDGSLLQPKAVIFQIPEAGLNTVPQSSFNNGGTGFAFWSDQDTVKARKISGKGRPNSSPKLISNSAADVSTQPAIAFDSQNNQFVGIWAEGKQIKGAKLNPSTGAVIDKPFDLAASTLTHPINLVLSYGAQSGNVLAVWEDAATPNAGGPDSTFRVRGGVLGEKGGGSETLVSVLDGAFTPLAVTIHAGTTVRWTSLGHMFHTVTSGVPGSSEGKLFDQGLGPGKSFTFRFTQTGTFDYFCRVHVQFGMAGKVIVIP